VAVHDLHHNRSLAKDPRTPLAHDATHSDTNSWHDDRRCDAGDTSRVIRSCTGSHHPAPAGTDVRGRNRQDLQGIENTKPVEPQTSPEQGYHFMADMTDKVIEHMRYSKSVAPQKPLFIYSPHHAPKQWSEKFKGQFDAGWEKVREATYARQLKLGIIPPGTKLTARPEWWRLGIRSRMIKRNFICASRASQAVLVGDRLRQRVPLLHRQQGRDRRPLVAHGSDQECRRFNGHLLRTDRATRKGEQLDPDVTRQRLVHLFPLICPDRDLLRPQLETRGYRARGNLTVAMVQPASELRQTIRARYPAR